MNIVKYYPSEEQSELISTLKKSKDTHLSAKVVKNHGEGIVDLVVNNPEGANVLVEKVSKDKDASPRYEELAKKK